MAMITVKLLNLYPAVCSNAKMCILVKRVASCMSGSLITVEGAHASLDRLEELSLTADTQR